MTYVAFYPLTSSLTFIFLLCFFFWRFFFCFQEHIQDSGELFHSSGTHIAVVAIDFGTTFSGFAFAFNNKEGEKSIHMNKEWGSDQGYSTLKTPTCLLLNADKSFNSFGYEAQDKYAELEEEEAQQYYYFERFKMILHNNEVSFLFTFYWRRCDLVA